MKIIEQFLNIETFTAIFAWFVVSASTVYLMAANGSFSIPTMLVTALLFMFFIFGFLAVIEDQLCLLTDSKRMVLIVLQYLSVLTIVFLAPFTHIAILITIWSAQLPYFISIRMAFLLSPLWTLPIWLVYGIFWEQKYIVLSAILYWSFNLFALVMVNGRLKEERARQEANELNRELVATQALLGEATKQAERVRIARNIHDLLGHHLTALTINLQVASRISEGQAQQKIQECHSLAKLLLSDVREAVSEIREKSNLQLQNALDALVENVPRLEVKITFSEELTISNVNVAETILRCVQEGLTNSLKHSNASDFQITLAENEQGICLEMQDNGQHDKSTLSNVEDGNGISGMKERINELGGHLLVEQSKFGFRTFIEIPALA